MQKCLALSVTLALGSAADRCCTTCNASAGLEKYFSVAEPLLSKKQQCGECCMNPKDFNEFHIFEKNLTKATTNTPCADFGFTDFLETDTHGFGPIKMTLDMFKFPTTAAAAAATAAAVHHSLPSTMREVRATGQCAAPFASCVQVDNVALPVPKAGEALIKVEGSSVNPSDVDTVEFGGCAAGCGADVSGTVVALGAGCTRLAVGQQVWTLSNPAYADFVVAPEVTVGLKPTNAAFAPAATVPEVGLTSLFSLKRTGSQPTDPMPAGSPWAARGGNLTVVITAGSGGTGSIGIEIAKAYGAKNIVTTASGAAGIAFVKNLGATVVTDYKAVDIFDTLADNSVDIVYDNYGAEGTADRAMRTIRPGGTYLLMPHGECYSEKTQGPPCLSANPKPGVYQVNYVTGVDFEQYALQGLDELKAMVEGGHIKPTIDKSFELSNMAAAFNYSAGPGEGGVGDHIGKISITTAA